MVWMTPPLRATDKVNNQGLELLIKRRIVTRKVRDVKLLLGVMGLGIVIGSAVTYLLLAV